MDDKKTYLKLATAIATALVLFALGVMLVGYQPFDAKHVATVVLLAAVAGVCGYFLRKQ